MRNDHYNDTCLYECIMSATYYNATHDRAYMHKTVHNYKFIISNNYYIQILCTVMYSYALEVAINKTSNSILSILLNICIQVNKIAQTTHHSRHGMWPICPFELVLHGRRPAVSSIPH